MRITELINALVGCVADFGDCEVELKARSEPLEISQIVAKQKIHSQEAIIVLSSEDIVNEPSKFRY